MRRNTILLLTTALGAAALVGCGEEPEITSYNTDKPGHITPENPQRPRSEGMPTNHPPVAPGAQTPGTQSPGTQNPGGGDELVAPTQLEGIAFEVPEAWAYTGSSQFLMASFQISPATKMTISQAMGALTAQVNRWRVQQLGLSAVEGEVEPASLEHIDSAVGEMRVVDLTSDDGTRRMRIGMMPEMKDGQPTGDTWFFKLTGDASEVEANKVAFDAMLGGLSVAEVGSGEETR